MLATTEPFYVRLSWTDPATGQELARLAPLPVTLGRAADNTLPLNSRSVSRQHAQIERSADGEVVLLDRSSSNGTFLAGQRVTRAVLREGASFQIGPFVFSISFWTPAQSQADAPMLSSGQGAAVPASSDQDDATVIAPNDASAPNLQPPPVPAGEVFPPASFQQPVVSVHHLRASGLPLTETTYLAIGG
ncbi:MAG TPA: FHA domain-containing protein, partial [Ktedonobacterales bacterium]